MALHVEIWDSRWFQLLAECHLLRLLQEPDLPRLLGLEAAGMEADDAGRWDRGRCHGKLAVA